MRVAMRLAFALSLFLLVTGTVYYVASDEWRGTVMLIVLAFAVLYLGLVFRGALKRASVPPTRETMAEEEVAEAHVGPTIWPFVVSLAAVLIVIGAVVAGWVLIPGVILLIGAGAGWFVDIKNQWHPGELHAVGSGAATGSPGSALHGEEHPDEADRE
jgi:hypothetical protein